MLAFLLKHSPEYEIYLLKNRLHFVLLVSGLLLYAFLPGFAWAKDEPKWLEIHTAHFSIITDGGEKRGHEVALRMEQMRAVFGQLLSKESSTCRCL